jgi:two-component system cell cycle sensor histidine kinase PleC
MIGMMVLRFVTLGDAGHIVVAGVLVIFGLLLRRLALSVNGAMSRSINLQSDKTALIEQLFRAKRDSDAARARAEEANRAKSHFLANMSHELRTPLNAIIGFSEIMEGAMFGPLGSPKYVEYAHDIHSSGQHLLELINDILDMSKIEAGRMTLEKQPTDLAKVIDESLRLVSGRAEIASVKVIDASGTLPQIEVDKRAIKQVLLNLLSNAIKFTPAGGDIRVESAVSEDSVTLSVVDSGIGIPAHALPKIGRPFEQVESQHSKKHKGTGLGLALSRSLVEMHGGTLKIESTEGVGTRVTFTLPA